MTEMRTILWSCKTHIASHTIGDVFEILSNVWLLYGCMLLDHNVLSQCCTRRLLVTMHCAISTDVLYLSAMRSTVFFTSVDILPRTSKLMLIDIVSV